jgi:hypothetical protein
MYLTEDEAKQQRALMQRVKNDFSYHSVSPMQSERITRVRNKTLELAYCLIENCRPSRELSLALTELEQLSFIANAGIARESNEQTP